MKRVKKILLLFVIICLISIIGLIIALIKYRNDKERYEVDIKSLEDELSLAQEGPRDENVKLELITSFNESTEYNEFCKDTFTQQEINICSSKKAEYYEKILNNSNILIEDHIKTYKGEGSSEELANYRDNLLDMFNKSKDQYESYEKAHCDFIGYEFYGGSMESMQVSECRASMRLDRIIKLRE
jgi:uncharacterized protein YecT (DUF1311 family)